MLIYQTPKGQKHTVYVYLKDGRVERFKNIVEINRLHSRYAWGVQDEYDFLGIQARILGNSITE